MIRELFAVSLVATVLGIMNTFDSLCEALFEPIVGAVLDMFWSGEIANGVHYFSVYEYKIALSLLPISMILALGTLSFIKETYCKQADISENTEDNTDVDAIVNPA